MAIEAMGVVEDQQLRCELCMCWIVENQDKCELAQAAAAAVRMGDKAGAVERRVR